MHLVVVQLASYRQLTRIDPERVTRIERSLCSTARTAAAGILQEHGPELVFVLETSRPGDMLVLCRTLWSMRGILDAEAGELLGYAIIADSVRQADAEGVAQLLWASGPATTRDGLWIGPSLAAVAASAFRTRKDGSWHEVLGLSGSGTLDHVHARDFLSRPELEESLLDLIADGINGASPGYLSLIHGHADLGTRYAVEAMLRRLNGDGEHLVWLSMLGLRGMDDRWYPFRRLQLAGWYERVAGHLSGSEAAAWADVEPVLRQALGIAGGMVEPSHASVDLRLGLDLFLLAYQRATRAQLLTPVLVLEDVDTFPAETASVLASVLGAHLERGAIVAVGTTASEVIPGAFRRIPARVMRVTDPGTQDIRDAAVEFVRRRSLVHVNPQRLLDRYGHSPVRIFHHLVVQSATDSFVPGDGSEISDPIPVIIGQLDRTALVLLHLAFVTRGLLGLDELAEVLGQLGLDAGSLSRQLAKLAALALVRDDNSAIPAVDCAQQVRDAMGALAAETDAAVVDVLTGMVEQRNGLTRRTLLWLLEQLGAGRDARRHLEEDVRRGMFLQGREELSVTLKTWFADPVHAAEAGGWLRVVASGLHGSMPEQQGTDRHPAGEDPASRAWWHRGQAEVLFADRAFAEAESHTRKAMLACQAIHDERGLAHAQLDTASHLLAADRLAEALEYIRLARSAIGPGQPELWSRCQRYLVISSFLSGNIGRSLEHARKLEQRSADLCFRHGEAWAVFAAGRAELELGRLEAAARSMDRCAGIARLYGMSSLMRISRIWRARIMLTSGDLAGASRIAGGLAEAGQLLGPDAALMQAERAIALQDWPRVVEYSGGLVERGSTERPQLDPVEWRSGYSCLEGVAAGLQTDTLPPRLLAMAYHGIARARLADSDGLRELYHLTREIDLSRTDPTAFRYLHLYWQVLPRQRRAGAEDPATVLGKALRILRQRASGIDQPDIKREYLDNNPWASVLMEDARPFNLV